MRWFHHRSIVILDDVDVNHAGGYIWPSLLLLQLLHEFNALRRELFLITVEVLGIDQPLGRIVLLLLFVIHGACAPSAAVV